MSNRLMGNGGKGRECQKEESGFGQIREWKLAVGTDGIRNGKQF